MKTAILILAACFIAGSANSQNQLVKYNHASTSDPEIFIAMNEDSAVIDFKSDATPTPMSQITEFPQFLGEDNISVGEFVYSNITFPEDARLRGSSGIVKVQFDIFPNGSIGNIGFIESPDVSFNREVETLLQHIPKWRPAYSGDLAVTSRYQLSINFSLQ